MLRYLRQLASESLIYGLSGVLSRCIGLFLMPIYTRVFRPSDYGVVALITTTMSLLSIFVVLGLDNSAVRWFWDTSDDAERKITYTSWAWTQVGIATLVGCSVVLLSRQLSQLILGTTALSDCFALAGGALPLTALGVVVTNWLRCQRRPVASMSYSAITSLVTIGLTVTFVIPLREGVRGVFIAQVLSSGISMLLAVALLRDWIHPRHYRVERLREMLGYAVPLIPGGLGLWMLSVVDRYFVQHYASASQVGLYQVGASFASAVALLVTGFTMAWGPFALSIHQSPHARQVYANALLAYTWVTCLLASAVALLAPEGLRLLTTRSYYGAESVIGLLALSWVLEGLYYIASIGPSLCRQTKPVGTAVVLTAGLNILLNFLLIPRWGKEGAAVATLVSQIFRAGYLFHWAQRIYPIPYRFGPVVCLIALSLSLTFMSLAWHPAAGWQSLVLKLSCLLLFAPMLLLLRIASFSQVRQVLRRAVVVST